MTSRPSRPGLQNGSNTSRPNRPGLQNESNTSCPNRPGQRNWSNPKLGKLFNAATISWMVLYIQNCLTIVLSWTSSDIYFLRLIYGTISNPVLNTTSKYRPLVSKTSSLGKLNGLHSNDFSSWNSSRNVSKVSSIVETTSILIKFGHWGCKVGPYINL